MIHAASGPLALVPQTLGEKVYALPVDPTVAPDTDAPQPSEEIEEEDARPGIPAPMVPGPTDEERRCHDLTHIPFRQWCPFCVGPDVARVIAIVERRIHRGPRSLSLTMCFYAQVFPVIALRLCWSA